MPATPHDGTGTVLTFSPAAGWGGGSTTYTVTNIVYSLGEQGNNVQPIDISHLGQTVGQSVLTMDRPLKGSVQNGGTTGRQVDMDYQGSAILADGVSGTLAITVGGSSWLSGTATVTTSSVTMVVNDIIRGKASFKIAR